MILAPDQAALLRTIIDNPADDMPRLVYFDWLEENTDDRNELCWIKLMRLQVALAAEHRKTYKAKIVREIKRLMSTAVAGRRYPELNHVMDEWGCGFHFDGWNYCVVPITPGVTIHRGFVRSVLCRMDWWEKFGPSVCFRYPVERVDIADKKPTQPIPTDPDFAWRISTQPLLYGNPWIIPDEIGGCGLDVRKDGFKSLQDAEQWLSDRCIAWAREQAEQLARREILSEFSPTRVDDLHSRV